MTRQHINALSHISQKEGKEGKWNKKGSTFNNKKNNAFTFLSVLENRNKKLEYKYGNWKAVSSIMLFLLSHNNLGLGFQPWKMRPH